MAFSANGWSANDRSVIASYSLPGGSVSLRKGDVSVVLLYCANRWHREVEPLRWPGIWGYAERPIRGGTALSNHASGTAIDLNAPAHPLGTNPANNFTANQIRKIHEIVAFCEGVVRWGGDYSGRKDGMHLEVNDGATAAQVRRIADKIRGSAEPKLKFPVSGSIRAAFDRFGGLKRLGQPLGPEVKTTDPRGRWQNFPYGRILWHPAVDHGVAHVIFGDIERRFIIGGYEPGMGWPITDEMPCPDGKGRYNHFTGDRSIYWNGLIGARLVKGAIRATWGAHGWERSRLGYPVDEEHLAEGGLVQTFQHGSILWKNAKATVRLR